jgi:hypothetical protein
LDENKKLPQPETGVNRQSWLGTSTSRIAPTSYWMDGLQIFHREEAEMGPVRRGGAIAAFRAQVLHAYGREFPLHRLINLKCVGVFEP